MTGEPEEIHARATGLEAKLDILSQSAKEMCSESDIFWMEIEKGKYVVLNFFLTKQINELAHKGTITCTQNHFFKPACAVT